MDLKCIIGSILALDVGSLVVILADVVPLGAVENAINDTDIVDDEYIVNDEAMVDDEDIVHDAVTAPVGAICKFVINTPPICCLTPSFSTKMCMFLYLPGNCI